MEDVVALHGFAGTGRIWDGVAERLDPARFRLHTPDLPGHGSASRLRPVTFATCVDHVLAAAPERFALCGYSLGGRVALHLVLAAPERVTRLVLVSATGGIDDDGERALRRRQDEQLADEIEHESIEAFTTRWTALPLFDGASPEAVALWRADIARNDPAALADVLRGIGTGAMEPLWPRLGELAMPAVVVAGERDPKYVALASRLSAALPAAASLVVPGAGHGLPREAPGELAAALALSSG
ncbi:MAG TPA: alpha/beta fold hydrolase [Solirubrobacteraceae bacterium]|nr:alpha/beta fold hydrolase [Solirubrobacteraceae bacterium]